MTKAVCFSLWGNHPKYNVGIIENAKLRLQIYPEWKTVVYLGQSVPSYTISSLNKIENTQLIFMDQPGDWTGMFWRFLPAFDEKIDTMISRDADSRLSSRERDAVNEWIESDKDFHIMRDHPYHNTAILGGMWGCRNNLLNKLGITIQIPDNGNFWQVDQNFLREYVYPKVKDHSFIHDSYNLLNEPEAKRFPSDRINSGFVGEIYDENNNRHPDHHTLL
jgi:hypothetical protein